MYILRRAAVRALTAQPSRQLSTLRPINSRIVVLDSAKPSLCRSFHQTRIWRAQEEENKVEELRDEAASAATAAEEAAEAAQQAADAAVIQAAAEPATQDAQDVSSSAEAAQQTAAAAASTAESAAAAAPSPFAPPPPQANFPPRNAPGPSFGGTPTPTPVIYVGNLFFEVTPAQLEAEFSRFGRIVNCRIVSDARALSKGFGYVEFDNQNAADQAVRELDQKTFSGRRMAVQYHVRREPRSGGVATQGGVGRQPNQPSKTLFIGNMSYQMSDRDLNDLFREIRDVLDVRVAIDRRSGQPRGFAHADFIDISSAQRAKEHLEKKVVYGRQLRVDFSHSSSGRDAPRQSGEDA